MRQLRLFHQFVKLVERAVIEIIIAISLPQKFLRIHLLKNSLGPCRQFHMHIETDLQILRHQ